MGLLLAVVADRFNRASFEGGLAADLFFRSRGLFEDVGIAVGIVACKVIRRLGTTGIAVDALIIDEKLPVDVVTPFF